MISKHLEKDFRLLKETFREEFDESEYLELLYLLSQDFSQRNLAELVSNVFNKDYIEVLNDIYFVGSSQFSPNRFRQKLIMKNLVKNGYIGNTD